MSIEAHFHNGIKNEKLIAAFNLTIQTFFLATVNYISHNF